MIKFNKWIQLREDMTRRGFLRGMGGLAAGAAMGSYALGGDAEQGAGWAKYKIKQPREMAGWLPTPEKWRAFLIQNVEQMREITKNDKEITRQIIPFLDGKSNQVKASDWDAMFLMTRDKLEVAMNDDIGQRWATPEEGEKYGLSLGEAQSKARLFLKRIAVWVERVTDKTPELQIKYINKRQATTTTGKWHIFTFQLMVK